VVVEGKAFRLTEEDMLTRLATIWLSKLDWRFDVVEGGFRDPATPGGDGDPDDLAMALVFGVAPSKVLAFGKGEPYSQTRYRF
jgi:hypothetical protein